MMSSDDTDGPVARKRPKRDIKKKTNVVFSSDEDGSSDSDAEFKMPAKDSSDTDVSIKQVPRTSKAATSSVRLNKSYRANSRATSMISAVDQIDDNDDEEERRARRRSRLLELHQRSMNSPGAKTAERLAKATPLSNMSEAAIAEHYGNCIKLAAENKINAKNAFSLHLIDYMNDLLQHDRLENFQVASSSLDAGAKIYAGRVDAVHQDTFKVLGGLGRSKAETTEPDDGQDAPEGDEQQQRPTRKANPKRKKNVIQKNLAKIRIKSTEFKTDVDPLFQHQAVAYDEGGTSELRLNNVYSKDNSSELILDSDVQMMGVPTNPRLIEDSESVRLLQLETEPTIRTVMGEESVCDDQRLGESLAICPALTDFKFTGWDTSDEPEPAQISLLDEHAFDPNADVEPVPPSGDISDVDVLPPDDNSVASGEQNPADTSVYIGESKEAMLVQSAVDGMIQSSSTFVDSLRMMLTEQLNNRGQLHDNLLGMWAGPDHWRTKAKSLFPNRPPLQNRRVSCSAMDSISEGGADQRSGRRGKTRLGQEKGYVALDDLLLGEDTCRKMEEELKKVFRRSRAALTLSDQCVDRSMKRNYLLPPVVDYEKQSIIQLMNKKVLVLTRTESTLEGGEVSDYNFDNPRDAANFCPPVEGAVNSDPVGSSDPVDDDVVDDLPPCGEDYGGGDDDAEPFAGAFTQGMAGDTQAAQLELVSQPRKIAKIEIGYAKTAKRINVRFIKSIMWNFLVSSERDKESERINESIAATSSQDPMASVNDVKVECPKLFSEMVQLVPKKVNKQVASDLTVPILLNCLLHLANEKGLQIESNDSFDELTITQGVAPPRHKERAAEFLRRNTAQSRLDEWMDTDDS